MVKIAIGKFKRHSVGEALPFSLSDVMTNDNRAEHLDSKQPPVVSKSLGPKKLVKLMASNDSLVRDKKERFIFDQSKLILSMPRLSLTIPTNLEDENCLTL